MSLIWFVTHADVVQDPDVPVPKWPLSDVGRARHAAGNAVLAASGITSIFCSDEQKARDGAAIHAEALGLSPRVVAGLGENDRSATGYLPPGAFEAAADAFFAEPNLSYKGWERACDAQTRIVAGVQACDDMAPAGSMLIVGHGGVGALLRAHVGKQPISRKLEAGVPGGGGVMCLTRGSLTLAQDWHPIDPS